MAKDHISAHQAKVIAGYYEHLDTIMLQKLAELVTDLYLAETAVKRDRLWQRAQKAMQKLKIPNSIIDHIMDKQDVEILAKNLQGWQKRQRKK